MLRAEGGHHPAALAYDRPSDAMRQFLASRYGLDRPQLQSNNFTIFAGFWEHLGHAGQPPPSPSFSNVERPPSQQQQQQYEQQQYEQQQQQQLRFGQQYERQQERAQEQQQEEQQEEQQQWEDAYHNDKADGEYSLEELQRELSRRQMEESGPRAVEHFNDSQHQLEVAPPSSAGSARSEVSRSHSGRRAFVSPALHSGRQEHQQSQGNVHWQPEHYGQQEQESATPQSTARAYTPSWTSDEGATDGVGDFFAAAVFAGPRPGFVFKTGPQGVGYYTEQIAADQDQEQQQHEQQQYEQQLQQQQQHQQYQQQQQQREEEVVSETVRGAPVPDHPGNRTQRDQNWEACRSPRVPVFHTATRIFRPRALRGVR
jgi:hypothetical protein